MKHIILFIAICIMQTSQAQTPDSTGFDQKPALTFLSKVNFERLFDNYFDFRLSSAESLFSIPDELMDVVQINHLPGLFCKIEYQLEARSKLAPRFRLGSLNYTDWMEGKGAFYSRYMK
jgi:hypothetical protein